MLENAFVISLLPAISFVLILVFGKRFKDGTLVHYLGIATVAVAFVLSLVAAGQWIDRSENVAADAHAEEFIGGSAATVAGDATLLLGTEATETEGEGGEHAPTAGPVINQITWLQSGGVEHQVGTYVDGLSVTLLVIVSLVSLLVHVYAAEYVKGDRRFVHFFAFLSLFTASMLFFVLSSSILQMIVGWELVGVCSFVLIGHWWEENENSNAALKAFLTNRVGDIGLIVGVIVLYFAAGTFDIFAINTMIANGEIRHLLLLVTALALTAAVMSKSGQFPLHTWLPDAMAGPTPVSALIHAATMVVAGVYLVARLYPVFYDGYAIESSSINVLAFVGGFTALMAAALAFAQWDIKKILAYSTVSQLGYMIMALGVGAWTAALFHLFTHALFKACLFLGAGSVSHAAHHTFDIREMGGLKKHMPVTFWTFVISSLALAGIFPLAGFWSKDEILVGAFVGQSSGYPLMLIFGVLVAAMTAAYMTRLIWYTFMGDYRGQGEPHESPKLMTVPLMVLAGGAVFGGLANLPAPVADKIGLGSIAHRIETYAEPIAFLEPLGFTVAAPSLIMALVGLGVALAGMGVTYLYFWRGLGPHGLTERSRVAKAGYTFLENKYYLDVLYTDIIVGSVKKPIAKAVYWTNQNIIDKVVNTAGESARDGGKWVYDHIDQAVVDGVVDGVGATANASGQGLRLVQSGKVQHYGALLFGSAAALAIIFVIVL